jgi:L-2-hydroxycarboxylate dehydrogenase (NAD+)
MRIAATDERRLIRAALEYVGVEEPAAEVQAEWLVEADLRGHPSHGLQRLPVLVGRVRNQVANPISRPRAEWIGVNAATIDGDRGLGPWVGTRVLEMLLERARVGGVAVGAVKNANHLGLLSLYAERAAAAGMIAIVLTTSEALVHPWGGRDALLGTNPIAIGVPASPEPFILDMATSAISMGKVLAYRQRGLDLSPGWAVDDGGEPTLDPEAARAVSPFGGPKGYALSLAFELIVASVSQTALGTEVKGTLDVEHPSTKGDLFIVVSPTQFGADEGSTARLGDYLEQLRASPPARGSEGVAIPGDGARVRRQDSLRTGVDVPDVLYDECQRLAPGFRVAA